MDIEQQAEALMAHIRRVREAFLAGRLTMAQVQAYRKLGRKVERITRQMDAAPDAEAAERIWRTGAALIVTYLDTHFAGLMRH
jgi:hypothetical protein